MGRPAKYAWADWFEVARTDQRKGMTIQQGRDFQISPTSMRQQVINEAARRKLTVETHAKRSPVDGTWWLQIKVVDPAAQTARGRDWDVIFKRRRATVLEKGRDFTCTVASMQQSAHQAATRRGITIKTKTDHTSVTIYPQAKPVTEMAPAEEADR